MMTIILKSKKYGIKECFIDDDDLFKINHLSWCIVPNRKTFYAMSKISIGKNKFRTIRMHQLIIDGKPIDHKNGNGLDNQKSNLRIATTQQNNFNVGLTKRNKTGFKGVCTRSANTFRPFIASIRVSGKLIIGGSFATAEEAALKYNEMALIHHGEFAWLNKL